jgi:hypothetical protein
MLSPRTQTTLQPAKKGRTTSEQSLPMMDWLSSQQAMPHGGGSYFFICDMQASACHNSVWRTLMEGFQPQVTDVIHRAVYACLFLPQFYKLTNAIKGHSFSFFLFMVLVLNPQPCTC